MCFTNRTKRRETRRTTGYMKSSSKLLADSITFGLVIKHTFVSMGLLITTAMCFKEKRSQKKLVRSAAKVTAFEAFNAKHGKLGPYWPEENGRTVTINGKRYIAILDQFHGN